MPDNPRTLETPAPRDLPTYTIFVEGTALEKSYQVLIVRVQKEVNRVPTAYITLKDGEPAPGGSSSGRGAAAAKPQNFAISNGAQFIPGNKLEIKAGYHGKEKTIFNGIVVRHGIEARTSGGSRLNLLCKDAYVKTTIVPRRRYFTDKKDSDIAEEIVQTYPGLQIDADTTTTTHKELIQYDATDWDYLVMRAETNGMLCLADDGTLKITKPDFTQKPIVALQYGATMLDFEAEMDARNQFSAVKTTTWNYTDQELTEAEANEPTVGAQGNLSGPDIAKALDAELTLQHGGKLKTEELQTWADAALLKRRMAKIQGRVRLFGTADIKPGTVINLGGLGERFNGDAFVTGVSHRLEDGGWQSDIQFGLNPRWFVTEVDVRQPPASGVVPAISGLQIGVVTGLEGDETSEERILVRLPVIDPAAEGTRARIVSLDAGDERGFFFRPQIGDEVVVGFLNNDPRDAIVLGSLHGSQKKLPDPFVTKDDNHLKGYVSRSKMKLIFDDEKTILTIKTPAGNQLLLDEDAKNITLKDQHGNKLVMNDQGIQIESSKDITLKAASGNVNVEGLGVELKANAQFKASGSAGVDISSAARTVVKGSIVQIN
ncbi:type VI secretion system tip protein VgrG [Spirosoma sp. KCTC 42546]|uniref:type VI secretion system tip protein VgrG n=1 Tax=Spirosoma sp. KCTC 42546 TaxID=2520506 RepID=UPI001157E333|nr:type VI secretion system tip protein VgrG [Spirosoma sp. KCTC 42546]QDK82119.1 type VI secretion system tip protein VgrG [Spirosoma sp. KCTC 42546]